MKTSSETVAIYGQPGSRARTSALFHAALPLCAVLLLCGYAIGALLPWPEIGIAWKCVLVVVAALAIFIATVFTGRRIDAFFKGASGEVAIAYVLARLPGGYAVFNGVDISGKGGPFRTHDFDHVVLTPTGLVVVETKNWRGRLTFDDGAIQIDGITPQRPPVAQVSAEATALSEWLANNTPESIPVIPLLCFAGDPLPADAPAEIGGVRLCGPDTLVNAIVATADGNPLPPATRERITIALAAQV
jgi:hypothetical protein